MNAIKKDLMELEAQKNTLSKKEFMSKLLDLCGWYGTEAIWETFIQVFGSPYKPF